MGASQSSKSQLIAQRAQLDDSLRAGDVTATAAGGCGQQQQQAVRHKLSASLRKSVNNVLASGGKSSSKGSPKGRKDIATAADTTTTNGSGLLSSGGGHQTDAYYVTHRANNNSNNFAATSSMNNYVTMQHQPPPSSATIVLGQNSAAAKASPTTAGNISTAPPTGAQSGLEKGNSTQNGVYGLVGGGGGGRGLACKSAGSASAVLASSSGGNYYTIEPMDMNAAESSAAVGAALGGRDGSFNSGNIAKESQLNMRQQQAENVGPLSRSQQRQLHPTSSPFQLSRAVNTKTSSVLSITNGPVAMPKSHGRQYQQPSNGIITSNSNGHPPSLATTTVGNRSNNNNNNNNSTSSISTPTTIGLNQTPPNNKSPASQYQPVSYHHPHHQISSSNKSPHYTSPAAVVYMQAAANKPAPGHLSYTDNHQDHDDGENQQQQQQFYARNLLDMDQLNGFQQQVRYKCPQQQYQYLNPNQHGAIDFHQATYNSHNSNNSPQGPYQQRGPPYVEGLKQQQLQLDLHSSYNRSYSFGGGSQTLEASRGSHKKSLNPLVSIFQGATTNNNKHSNTISLAKHRNNKSSANINNNNSINQRSFSGSLKRIKSTPLTAQQATYEAMRTIDMYLIRQIARSCMDFEMEQKIDLEIRLRELAAQSMLEARTEIDVLEVEKSLLTSDQRMNCYASQLDQQRKQLSNPSLSTDSGRGSKSGHRGHRSDVIDTGSNGGGSGNGDTSSPSFSSLSNSQSPSKLSPVSGQSANSPSFTGSSHNSKSGGGSTYAHRRSSSSNTLKRAKNKKREQLMQSITSLSNINCNMTINNRASVSVSEIRIPLMWRDVDHFKGRGDYKRFAVFCLLKIDSQIYDTQLISDVDRQVTDVTFDDLVVFNEIDHNFELTLEVYSCVYLEQFSLSSTPRKLKEKLTSSVSRAMGRRLATQTASVNYTKELQAYDKSYRFAMIASATLRLEDASDSVKTYDLVLVSPSAHHRNYPMYSSNQSHSTMAPSMTLSNTKEINKNTLPLFGHFCCKLFVRPDVYDKGIKTGYLKVATISAPTNNDSDNNLASSNGGSGRDGDSPSSTNNYGSTRESSKLRTTLAAASGKMATLSMSSSTVHWGLLRNFALHLWPIDEQRLDHSAIIRGELLQLDNPRKPPLTLNIDKYTRLLRVSNSSLTLETGDCCFVLSTYCRDAGLMNQADEISHWLGAIEQQIYDSHIWGSVLNHYPPHTKQPTSDGGRILPNHHGMRNVRNSKAATSYS